MEGPYGGALTSPVPGAHAHPRHNHGVLSVRNSQRRFGSSTMVNDHGTFSAYDQGYDPYLGVQGPLPRRAQAGERDGPADRRHEVRRSGGGDRAADARSTSGAVARQAQGPGEDHRRPPSTRRRPNGPVSGAGGRRRAAGSGARHGRSAAARGKPLETAGESLRGRRAQFAGCHRPSRRALIATMTVESDIRTAPRAGDSTIP